MSKLFVDHDGPAADWYGACGVPYCDTCYPRFDANNNEIPEEKA